MEERFLKFCMVALVAVGLSVNLGYAAIDRESIVAVYQFEDMGDGVLVDSSGNGHDIPIVKDGELVDSVDKKFGKALKVISSTFAQLDAGEAEDFSLETMTIAAWFNATGSGHRYITCKGSADPGRNFFLNINTGNELVYGYSGLPGFLWSGRDSDGNPKVLENDTWYHGAGTYDGQVARVYVDGELAAEKVGDPPTPSDQPFTIGGGVNEYPFNDCMMDELLIANVAFDPEDIKKIMNLGATAVTSAGKLTTTWANIKKQ